MLGRFGSRLGVVEWGFAEAKLYFAEHGKYRFKTHFGFNLARFGAPKGSKKHPKTDPKRVQNRPPNSKRKQKPKNGKQDRPSQSQEKNGVILEPKIDNLWYRFCDHFREALFVAIGAFWNPFWSPFGIQRVTNSRNIEM